MEMNGRVPTHLPRASKNYLSARTELPPNEYLRGDISPECKSYIREALLAHGKNRFFDQKVERRALIVAPQYKDYDAGMHLPETAVDIQLVHQMLVKFGYKPENIRILCDVYPGSGNSYPTKMNILNGLEWLVDHSELTPNAYRFLHFSGHGIHVPSAELAGPVQGKLILHSDWNAEKTPITRDSERSSSQMFAGRIEEREVTSEAEMRHYNEAILTRKDVSDEEEPINAILDIKLNEYLSMLPADCTITCTLDCCASGRMLNLDTKVAGSGWRAGWRGKPNDFTVQANISKLNQSLNEDLSRLSLRTLPSIQTEHEDLPLLEKAMNNVVAKIFSWSASHQRQEAWNDGSSVTGLFTQVFTQTCLELKDNPNFTYGHLHKVVSRRVAQQRKASSDEHNLPSRPQFVQLWTSSKGADPITKNNLSDSKVVF